MEDPNVQMSESPQDLMLEMKAWLEANQDKADTPDYLQVTKDFETLKQEYLGTTEETTSEEPYKFNKEKMFENFVPSLQQELKDIWSAISTPIETSESLWNLGTGVLQKLVPGEQKNEVYADLMGQYFANKYGSKEAFLRALENEPAGVLGDLSMFVTGGGKLAQKLAIITGKTEKALGGSGAMSELYKDVAGDISKVGTAIDPINLSLNVGGAATIYPFAQASRYLGEGKFANLPETFYESALKPSTTLTDAESAKLIKTGLDEGITLDRSGIIKAEKRINELSERIDNLLNLNPTAKISGNVVTKYLDDLENQATEFIYNSRQKAKEIQKVRKTVKQTINDFKKKHGKPDDKMTAKEMQKFKQSIYDEIDWDIEKKGGQGIYEQKGLREVGRAAKESIEKMYPDVADLNAQLGNLLEAKPFFERAKRRIANRDMIGIGTPMKATAGRAVGGDVGGALGVVLGAADAPGIKSKIGLGLYDKMNTDKLIRGFLSDPAGITGTGPTTRGILGATGDVNTENRYEGQGLLSMDSDELFNMLYGQ